MRLQYPHHRLGHSSAIALAWKAQDFVSKIHRPAKMDRAEIRKDGQGGFKVI